METIVLQAFNKDYELLENYVYKTKLGINITPKQRSRREKNIMKKMRVLLNKPQITQVECVRDEV